MFEDDGSDDKGGQSIVCGCFQFHSSRSRRPGRLKKFPLIPSKPNFLWQVVYLKTVEETVNTLRLPGQLGGGLWGGGKGPLTSCWLSGQLLKVFDFDACVLV